MRDNEDGEFDADVGEMLGYLKFDDDGAMWFADFDGAWKYFYHDCDEATARWAFDRLGPERFGDTTVTPVSVPVLGGRPPPQFHPLPTGSVDAALAGRYGRAPTWRRAVDHRHVTLAVPEPPPRARRTTGARHDHPAAGPLVPG